MWKHTFKKCVFFLAVLWYKRKGPINRTYPAIKASIFWCCKRSIFVTNSIYYLWGNAPRKHEPQISRVCPCPPNVWPRNLKLTVLYSTMTGTWTTLRWLPEMAGSTTAPFSTRERGFFPTSCIIPLRSSTSPWLPRQRPAHYQKSGRRYQHHEPL